MHHGCILICSIVMRVCGSMSSMRRRMSTDQLAPRSTSSSSLCACPRILVHGSYCNSWPVRYAAYSGLFVDGSSHGVSVVSCLRKLSCTTHCPQAGCIAPRPCPICRPAPRRTQDCPARQAAFSDSHQSVETLTSGATYGRLPHRPLSNLVLPLCRKTAQRPKSDTFRFPFAAKSRFSGLRSRCAMPRACINSC